MQKNTPSRILLELTKGDRWHREHAGYTVVLDDQFTDNVLRQYRWHKDDFGYPRTNLPPLNGKKRLQRLHRMVFEHYNGSIPQGVGVDHIDRNPLNNCPDNLQLLTQGLNVAKKSMMSTNTSGFINVHLEKSTGKWIAQVSIRGTRRRRNLGRFSDKLEAAKAADKAFREIYPEVDTPNGLA